MFCHHCDDSLAGHRYVLRDDHPYCIKCYENVFANNCDECGKVIGIDSKVKSFSDLKIYQDLIEFQTSTLIVNWFCIVGFVVQGKTLARDLLCLLQMQSIAC